MLIRYLVSFYFCLFFLFSSVVTDVHEGVGGETDKEIPWNHLEPFSLVFNFTRNRKVTERQFEVLVVIRVFDFR